MNDLRGRYELKFLITPVQKARFLSAAAHGLNADPHGIDASYRVSSLYFDTPGFNAYWEKVDGEAIRRKYRLRYYSHGSEEPSLDGSFMEIKHRIDNTVYKQRVRLGAAGTLALLESPEALSRIGEYCDDPADPTARLIEHAATTLGLNPAVVITYCRQAWLGTVDARLRVTFDSECQAYEPAGYRRVGSGTGTPLLSDRMVMEVKFDAAVPCWIRDILVSQGLMIQRFSKYAAGVSGPARSQFSIAQDAQTRPVAAAEPASERQPASTT